MGGFHPERAVERWRDRVAGAETPRDALRARSESITAVATLLNRLGDPAAADEMREAAADLLGDVFEKYAPRIQVLLASRRAPRAGGEGSGSQ